MTKIRLENDPLAGWLDERRYGVGDAGFITVKIAYADFEEYCRENGNAPPNKITFTKRLRSAGYKIDFVNHETGVILHYGSMAKNDSVDSVCSVPLVF
jgi:hypothetical protein